MSTKPSAVPIAYKGLNKGTVSTHGQIGHGWSSFVDVFVPGDMTNDGRMDLVGVRGDGKMFLGCVKFFGQVVGVFFVVKPLWIMPLR